MTDREYTRRVSQLRPEQYGTADAPNPQQWLGQRETCRLLNVAHTTLYRWVDARILCSFKPAGGVPMFWRPEVEALARRRRVAPPDEQENRP